MAQLAWWAGECRCRRVGCRVVVPVESLLTMSYLICTRFLTPPVFHCSVHRCNLIFPQRDHSCSSWTERLNVLDKFISKGGRLGGDMVRMWQEGKGGSKGADMWRRCMQRCWSMAMLEGKGVMVVQDKRTFVCLSPKTQCLCYQSSSSLSQALEWQRKKCQSLPLSHCLFKLC